MRYGFWKRGRWIVDPAAVPSPAWGWCLEHNPIGKPPSFELRGFFVSGGGLSFGDGNRQRLGSEALRQFSRDWRRDSVASSAESGAEK